MLRPIVRTALGLCACAWLAGCGLISSDITEFDLTLPDKNFSVNIDGWQVDRQAAATYFSFECADKPPTTCNAAVQPVCKMGCSGSCNASTKKCDLSLDVSLAQMVNLVMERPELQSVNDHSVIKVTVDNVTYEVTQNTLNIDTPVITIYVAPISVTTVKANDPSIKVIGTIDPVSAGESTTGPQQLKLTASGKAELANIMSSFKTPFNVLVGSQITVTAGQAVPMGHLNAVVHITGHAGL